MIDRMIRATKLDVSLYEEVETDASATGQALAVVIIVALVTAVIGIGEGFAVAILGVVFSLIGWALWAAITYFIGTKLLPEPQTHADWGQMARVLGFAQSVGVLRVFGIIPFIGGLVLFVVAIWQLIAMVVAVRQGLDYTSTFRAVGVVLIGFIPYVVLLGILTWLTAPAA
jgi:hypothetical protein